MGEPMMAEIMRGGSRRRGGPTELPRRKAVCGMPPEPMALQG